ncbi:hypothetical protein KP509_1Z201700 [Ceratopteris richardii]|nr:hypothetical protein KP509_1Z201700 [Ceratopteris richardii]
MSCFTILLPSPKNSSHLSSAHRLSKCSYATHTCILFIVCGHVCAMCSIAYTHQHTIYCVWICVWLAVAFPQSHSMIPCIVSSITIYPQSQASDHARIVEERKTQLTQDKGKFSMEEGKI